MSAHPLMKDANLVGLLGVTFAVGGVMTAFCLGVTNIFILTQKHVKVNIFTQPHTVDSGIL